MGQKKTKRRRKARPYPGLKEATLKARKKLEQLEKRYLISTLRKYKGRTGNAAKAAKAAKMSRTNFYRHLKLHKIIPDSYRSK